MLLNDYTPTALVGPSYNVYHYKDGIYKVVHFKNPRLLVDQCRVIDKSKKGGTEKLAPAISRAKKVVLELALCNDWDWFGTFTLDKEKYDRFNLDKWYKDFTQWIRDQRKKYGLQIRYVLVPELHQDGAWHMHGLLSNLPPVVPFSELRKLGHRVPDKLVNGGYECWLEYDKKFGYNSLGAVRSPVGASFYMAEYIGKDLHGNSVPVGRHLYYACKGLNRSTLHNQIYGECDPLNKWCVNKYEFCETGFTHVADGLDWSFALDLANTPDQIPDYCFGFEPDYKYWDEWFVMQEGIQEVLEGFL